MENQEKYVIVTGDPVDGLSFVGPFDSHFEAVEWAAENCENHWWEAPLEAPQ